MPLFEAFRKTRQPYCECRMVKEALAEDSHFEDGHIISLAVARQFDETRSHVILRNLLGSDVEQSPGVRRYDLCNRQELLTLPVGHALDLTDAFLPFQGPENLK
jgi:hypothetical protein